MPDGDMYVRRKHGGEWEYGGNVHPHQHSRKSKRIIATEDGQMYLERDGPPGNWDHGLPPGRTENNKRNIETEDSHMHHEQDGHPGDTEKTAFAVLLLVLYLIVLCYLNDSFDDTAEAHMIAVFVAVAVTVVIKLVLIVIKLLFKALRQRLPAVVGKLCRYVQKNAKTILIVTAVMVTSVGLFRAVRLHLKDECDVWTDNPYEILNLPRDASASDVKSKYRKISLKCHPDKVISSRKGVAEQGFQKIQKAHDALVDNGARKVYDECGHIGADLFLQGQSAAKACEMAKAIKLCGQVGMKLVGAGLKANDACSWATVYNTCGEDGLALYEHNVPARDACAWINVYKTCGEQGLSLFRQGIRPHRACAKLREMKEKTYSRSYSYHHYDPIAEMLGGYDPLAHVRQTRNQFGYHHHHHHHGAGFHGMPFW